MRNTPKNLNEELMKMRRLMRFDVNGHSHNILTEQNFKGILKEEESTGNLSVEKTINFKPGFYSNSQTDVITKKPVTEGLESELVKIKEFLKKNPEGYIVRAVLESGESRIPNTDNEMGRKRVEPGYLSNKRMDTLESFLSNTFKEWKKEGILKGDFKVEKKDPKIGETVWVGQPFCPKEKRKPDDPEGYKCSRVYYDNIDKYKSQQDKYTSEQYLKVIMGVEKVGVDSKKSEQCLNGLKVDIKFAKHNCNNAEYFLVANNTPLFTIEGGMTANGSNAKTKKVLHGVELGPEVLNPGYGKIGTTKYGFDGDLGKERYDSFVITDKQSKEIMEGADDKNSIYLWLLCIEKNCHDDRVSVKVTSKDKVIFEGSPTTSNSLLLKFNACEGTSVVGSKVSTEQTAPEIGEWVNKLMSYKKNIYNKLGSKLDAPSDVKNEKLKQIEWISKQIDLIKNKTLEMYSRYETYKKNKYNENNKEAITKMKRELNVLTNGLTKNITFAKLTFDTKGKLVNKTYRTNDLYGDVRNEMKTIINNLTLFYQKEEFPIFKRKGISDKQVPIFRDLIKTKYISPDQQATQLMAKN